MVDNVNPVDPASAPDKTSGVASFFASTSGKLVVGGLLVLVVIGVLVAIFFAFFAGGSSDQSTTGNGVVVKGQSGSTETTAVPVEPEQTALRDSFTFRPNIFAPTVSLPASTTASTATSSTGGTGGTGGSNVPANTLLLQSIQVVNGENLATLVWNGQTYSVGAGQAVGDTPWQVLSVSGSSVVMLYGDNRITISLGQGITK